MLDRPRREEELGRDLLVGEALRNEARDLKLLGRELVGGARVALSRRLAGRAQLDPRPLRPLSGVEALEPLQRRSQVLARVRPPAKPPEVLAVEQLNA